ncbi:hypothetical protein JW926_15805 [Candidatus Sumerlaeota bacterium]|nr:hypothetical protein [Candidatus Sumerlaeota bacterium]
MINFRLPHSFSFLFLVFLTCLFSTGCGQKGHLRVNPEFSVNLAIPDQKYPPLKQLSATGKEAFEIYGRPDFVRLWWSKDGRIHRFLEVDRALQNKSSIYRLRHSWIYVDKKIEIVFSTSGSSTYKELPITDKIQTICAYGDPEDIKRLSEEKPLRENWSYYSIGLILMFEDDKLIKEQRHNPMGAFIKR